jgi:hypothetical protein
MKLLRVRGRHIRGGSFGVRAVKEGRRTLHNYFFFFSSSSLRYKALRPVQTQNYI